MADPQDNSSSSANSETLSTHGDSDSSVESGASSNGVRQTTEGFGAAIVRLKPGKARPFWGRHPWVLDTAISAVEGSVADGGLVELVSDKNRFVARGIYNSQSRIRVRLYSWEPSQKLDDEFWRARLQQALELRAQLQLEGPQSAARLVFSEADGLSGLIVDRFDRHLVVQINAAAMATRLPLIKDLLVQLYQPQSILVRSEVGMQKAEGMQPPYGPIWGQPPEGPVFIQEHGVRYGVELLAGQKTGFYLDQRDNRLAAAAFTRDRRVLDMFCYTGGFGLTAAVRGQARDVLAIDSSEAALRWARANADLNGVSNITFQQQDCFRALDELSAANQRFGTIVLDPPKFTRNRYNVTEALRAYHRINRVAVDLLEPYGTLVTCSCSGSVTREDFLHMLAGVAEKSRRTIQVLQQRGPAADHPVSTSCLENEYLKCFICRVI